MSLPIDGKTILISGGTGTFGNAFVKRCLTGGNPKLVIIYSRDELKQLIMSEKFPTNKYPIKYVIGDLRDKRRLSETLKGVDIVIHAGALKEVPTCEFNPTEAIETNIGGTRNIVEASDENGVHKFIFLSSDKAVYPVNLYGATKMCGEKIVLNKSLNSNTFFSVVRYGNVIGSRGSIFDLIKNPEVNVKVTHPEMTRFWLSEMEAVKVVLDIIESMSGGEIFVPKLKSCRILEIFKELMPGKLIEYSGIRKGEKLHETLLTKEESKHCYSIGNYYVVKHTEFRIGEEKDKMEFTYTSENSLMDTAQIKEFFSKRGVVL